MMMSRLKELTRPHHDAVELRMGSYGPTESIEGYTRVLRRFLGFHRPVEEAFAALAGWDAIGIDPAERSRTALLEADLRALGLSDAEVAAVPRCPAPPPLASLPEALGAMYVLEGSTLGGQYIRKRVESTLGLAPGRGCSYYASYGDRVGPMWKAFAAAVDGYATTEDVQATIARSASATFDAVNDWFAGDEADA
ncbi:biliverdin-producing heme oxygenase [Paludisphaera mucosa]|uniref:Biliverdin-producing heme oxygenase n=1 Tax=Paludisphaera mucosa TaxID=3030827 RepID=A0ABT6FHI7_9BACT|nr:biliverdin-producing heme oxygenase [Paludisphaera mucosa]MDG3007032.1 biliverdin-producing heme oxygenase [Paludisphaera mucosa]